MARSGFQRECLKAFTRYAACEATPAHALKTRELGEAITGRPIMDKPTDGIGPARNRPVRRHPPIHFSDDLV